MQKLAASFSRAADWLRQRKKLLFVSVVAMVATLSLAQGVFADTNAIPDPIEQGSVADFAIGSILGGNLMNFLAWVLNSLATIVAKLTVTLIDAILVPILNYNGFATSQIVDLGWSLVRDTVNMFVVVVLLVIAVLTIVGSDRANWQQQIPRLFIFTVAVNFSRTICGIAIDVSNVVMFQFVNAILTVGAGNFTQLLQLQYYGDFSLMENAVIRPAEMFGTAWLQLALMLAVLGVILIMTVIYLYRIVVLWILIIMSPLAFFANGIKGVFGPAASIHGEWMKRFTSALLLGPVLTFFLWLALAAASGGDIITSENFPVGESSEGFGIALKVLEMSNLTGLLLALVLLTVGMSVAGSFASGLGDFAGKLVNGGMGATLAKRALRFPALGFREFGRQADRRVGRRLDLLTGEHRGSVLSHLGANVVMKGGEKVRTWGAQNGLVGSVVGATVGRGLSSVGDRITRQGEHMNHDATHNSEERVKNWSDDRLKSELQIAAAAMAAGTTLPLALRNRDAQNEAFTRALTNGKMVRELEGTAEGRMVLHQGMKAVEAHRDHLKDDQKKSFDANRSRNAHLMVMTEVTAAVGTPEYDEQVKKRDAEMEDLRKFVNSDKFDAKQLRDAAMSVNHNGDAAAETHNLRAGVIEEAMQDKVVKTTKEGPVTAWEEATQGAYGQDMRRALELRGMPLIDNATIGTAGTGGVVFSPDQIKASISADRLNVKALTASDFSAANPHADSLALALVEMGRKQTDQLSDTSGAYAAFQQAATRLADTGVLSDKQRATVDANNLRNVGTAHENPARTTAEQVFRDPNPNGEYDLRRIEEAVRADAYTLRHLAAALSSSNGNEVARVASNAMSREDMRYLAQQFASASAGQQAQIRETFTNAIEALRTHLTSGTVTGSDRTPYEEKWMQLRASAGRVGMPDPGDAP